MCVVRACLCVRVSGVLAAFVSVCWGVCAFLHDVCVRACVCSFACCACMLVWMCVRLQAPIACVRTRVRECVSACASVRVLVCLPPPAPSTSRERQDPSSKFPGPHRSGQEHLPRWTACLSLFSSTGRRACRPLHREASSTGDRMAPLAGDRGWGWGWAWAWGWGWPWGRTGILGAGIPSSKERTKVSPDREKAHTRPGT